MGALRRSLSARSVLPTDGVGCLLRDVLLDFQLLKHDTPASVTLPDFQSHGFRGLPRSHCVFQWTERLCDGDSAWTGGKGDQILFFHAADEDDTISLTWFQAARRDLQIVNRAQRIDRDAGVCRRAMP